MTEPERQKWERVRAKGHTRYIFRSFLLWGAPMWAFQILTTFFYDTITHKPYTPPFLIWTPITDFIFNFVGWVFGFGYLIGEVTWRQHEKDYNKDDHVV